MLPSPSTKHSPSKLSGAGEQFDEDRSAKMSTPDPMKYTLTVEVAPAAPFGVPEDGMTVLPPGTGEYFGASYHTDTLTRVGYGALSRYRQEDEAIRLEAALGNVEARVHDNFVFLDVDAPSHRHALQLILARLESWLQHLSLNQGRLYTYTALILESEDRHTYPLPKFQIIANVTHYHLNSLAEDLKAAAAAHDVGDKRLRRALQYLEDAYLMFEKRSALAPVTSPQHTRLIAAAFLSLWKAAASIVGDPSVDRDYQRRYRELGYDQQFFETQLEPLREMRNVWDVAHYSLDTTAIDAVEKQFGDAQRIVTDVLKRYRSLLISRSPAQSEREA